MDDPVQIRQRIADTREAIDNDLDALDARARRLRTQARQQAMTWLPVAAIGAGVIGAVALWPRGRRSNGRTRDVYVGCP